MPDVRRLLGKEVADIPQPRSYVAGLELRPVTLFGSGVPAPPQPSLWSTHIDNSSELILQATVQPDVLPSLLEMAQPTSTRRTYAFDDGTIAGCSVLLDFLPYLLELAQPASTRETYSVRVEIGPLDSQLTDSSIELAQFPLVLQQLATVALPTVTDVSVDLLSALSTPKVMGMTYQDRNLRALPLPGLKESDAWKQKGTTSLTKSYTEAEPGQRRGRKAKPKQPTFWDLVYVVLQPPIVLEQLENLYLPHDLFPYQPAGIEFLMNNESALLADEMGTGKTVMTTVAIRILMQQGRAKRALVVCPLSVLREWSRHLEEWAPDLLVTFVRGAPITRRMDWEMPAHVYVTTYDILRSDIEGGAVPGSVLEGFDIVVLDEAQNIKNPTSGRSRAIRKLRSCQRWALTGTPVENKVDDIGSIFGFLRPGYLKPFDLYPARIKERIAPYFLRRRKADVLPDLPKKQKQDIWLELDTAQRAEYDQVADRVRHELLELGAQVTKIAVMQRIQRLKQICNFASDRRTSPKLDCLKDQVEEIIQSGQKVIVFSQYLRSGVEILEGCLKPYGIAKIVGGQSESMRNSEIERFKCSPEVSILLASVRAGGVGLNLTEASYVVHFDHWWNPAVMWQAEARVHRPGQTRGVNVYSYWMEDTIEERIYGTLQKKGLLFEDVVDGLSRTQIDELISTQEWLEMLGVKVRDEVIPQPKRQALGSMNLTEIREHLYEITPAAFEQLVKELMNGLGYPNVKVSGRSGDGGIDVISTRNTPQGVVRVVAQCKRYRGTVGVEVARELRGVMASDMSIHKAFLVTTGEFSRECLGFCEKSGGLIVPISGLQVANYVRQFGLAA